ncbi:hypothetical protein C8A01DRAFT_42341, partial [Parachaetomium inaequale]
MPCWEASAQVLKEISRKVSRIQDPALSDYQIRDVRLGCRISGWHTVSTRASPEPLGSYRRHRWSTQYD